MPVASSRLASDIAVVENSRAVLVATDLTEASDAALARGAVHAKAVSAPIVVCHVVPDVFRSHPLLPAAGVNETTLANDLIKRAADLVTAQIKRVTGLSPDDVTVIVENGNPADEIVRVAEELEVSLVVIGASPKGRNAARIVRYAHGPVLVARATPATSKIVVATDFTEPSLSALRIGKSLVEGAMVDATLLHVMLPPAALLSAATSPLGSPIVPPSSTTFAELEKLGKDTLDGLAKQYKMTRAEQVDGDPAEVIVARAKEIGAEMIIVGSRGHTGLARLVLGSTAEHIIHEAHCSVLVARDQPAEPRPKTPPR